MDERLERHTQGEHEVRVGQAIDYCCEEMETLKNPDSGCDVRLDEGGLLMSCDDYGGRLPSVKFCPYCGKEVKRDN